VFLTSLDGIQGVDAVVYVFTTNCPVDLIDPAFRRPGRIDLTVHFPKPNAELRTRLVGRWDPDIRAAVAADRVAAETAGLTFAEIEELKNLLVLHFLDTGRWDWTEAVRQFRVNRAGFDTERRGRRVGFGTAHADETMLTGQPVCN
jgi:cell division protease FtsH